MQCPQCGKEAQGDVCAACGAPLTEETPKWYVEGIAHLTEQKQYAMAYQLLEEGLQRYSNSALLWFNGGILEEVMGNRKNAVARYAQAVKLRPDSEKYIQALERITGKPVPRPAKPAPPPQPAPPPKPTAQLPQAAPSNLPFKVIIVPPTAESRPPQPTPAPVVAETVEVPVAEARAVQTAPAPSVDIAPMTEPVLLEEPSNGIQPPVETEPEIELPDPLELPATMTFQQVLAPPEEQPQVKERPSKKSKQKKAAAVETTEASGEVGALAMSASVPELSGAGLRRLSKPRATRKPGFDVTAWLAAFRHWGMVSVLGGVLSILTFVLLFVFLLSQNGAGFTINLVGFLITANVFFVGRAFSAGQRRTRKKH